MMMKRIFHTISLIILATSLSAQSYTEHRGDIAFEKFNFKKAANLYKAAFDKDSTNHTLIRKLALSYKNLERDSLSSIWYEKLTNTDKADSTDYLNYYIVLKNIGNVDMANNVINNTTANSNKNKYQISRKLIDGLKSKPYRYNISIIEESSSFSEFAPAYFGSKILFVSSRQGPSTIKKNYVRDEEPFLQLFIADIMDNGQLSNIKEFTDRINTRYHEGPISYNVIDSTLYFTRNNFNQYKKLSSDGKLNLKIYTTKFTFNQWLKYTEAKVDSLIGSSIKLTEKDWRNIQEFKFNNDEYSTGHPTLSADGSKIYFVSDMPGGIGGTDIYMCELTENNNWSKPINLKEINTKGNEMFPFIHANGILYFASDGLPGLGGLDIFKTSQQGDKFSHPENLGAPVNSAADDFGLIIDNEVKSGYFSSNRGGGKGSDDLYFVEFTNIRYATLLLKIIDKETLHPLTSANISITDKNKKNPNSTILSEAGTLPLKINIKDSCLTVDVNLDNYSPANRTITFDETKINNDTITETIALERKVFFGLYGAIFQKNTKDTIPYAEITFTPHNGKQTFTINSESKGEYRTLLTENTSYDITISKRDYFTTKTTYTTTGKNSGWINLDESIDKIELNKTIEIPNIYYDLGKWNIRKDAAVELNFVVEFLNDNPNVNIELGSHTDSRGNSASNQSLSQKRAQSAVDYIISKGISKDRIVAKGYGESMLKNRCADGVKCTEKEHQENRRTEIRVTSF